MSQDGSKVDLSRKPNKKTTDKEKIRLKAQGCIPQLQQVTKLDVAMTESSDSVPTPLQNNASDKSAHVR
jgi:hypothetical protein